MRLKLEDLNFEWTCPFKKISKAFSLKGEDKQDALAGLNYYTLAMIEPKDKTILVDAWLGCYPYGVKDSYILGVTSNRVGVDDKGERDEESYDNVDWQGFYFVDDKKAMELKIKKIALKLMNRILRGCHNE